MRKPLPACLFLGFFLSPGVHAADAPTQLPCRADFEPADAAYPFLRSGTEGIDIPAGSVIGQVHYTRLPIFNEADPDENRAIYRWANDVHILTREHVVTRQMLFAPGDTYDPRVLQESARLLRRQEHLFDADIRPVSLCDNVVDVEVITKDTWSFTPSLSFDRSGGDNTYGFFLQESNVLGYGKQIILEASNDVDRSSVGLRYNDPNLFGTRLTTELAWIDSDDGDQQLIDLRLPFYELDSTRAWALRLDNTEREDPQFRRGTRVTEVRHDIRDYSLEYGVSRGLEDGWVRRWTLGWRQRDDRFSDSDDRPPPSPFPVDRELSYPYIGVEWIEDAFTTAFNLDRLYRTEDLHLGLRLQARLGYAAENFGSRGDWLVLDGSVSDTLRYTGTDLLQHSLQWEGLWDLDEEEARDVLLSYQARYFHRRSDTRAFFARFETSWSKDLNTHRQVELGGLNGARGFRNRFQTGDSHAVLSLEERVYTDIHLWNLIRVGGAVFLDIGRTWKPEPGAETDDPLLANAGFGLRLASSKASSSRIVHIDFAFPLTNRDDPQVDSFEVAVNIKGAF